MPRTGCSPSLLLESGIGSSIKRIVWVRCSIGLEYRMKAAERFLPDARPRSRGRRKPARIRVLKAHSPYTGGSFGFRLAVFLFSLLDGRPSIEQDVVERLKASFLLICGDAPVFERGEHGLIVLILQPVAGGRQGIQVADQPPPPPMVWCHCGTCGTRRPFSRVKGPYCQSHTVRRIGKTQH